MAKQIDYQAKFENFSRQTHFGKLPAEQQVCVREIAFAYRLTFQEFRQLVEAARDLQMWGEGGISSWWQRGWRAPAAGGNGRAKAELLHELQEYLHGLRRQPKAYPEAGLVRPKKREKNKIVTAHSEKTIFGMCPVASEKTVCCNLRTIDAVENCIFGCSYCTIQTFYSDRIVFDADLARKLRAIELDPNRFYHIGTGQSSDSLVWGNRNGNLDALCEFAAAHPNVLLELKTKSDNIRYFMENRVPPNIVCSWSLNTPVIIRNEEHFTASLDARVQAARSVANRGVKVAFHFHPMVYHAGWENDYPAIARRLMASFDTSEVLFISFGSVTFIKPVLKKMRDLGYQTRITQMEFVPDPHGKLTYPDPIKVAMFRRMYAAFKPWHDAVFFYLCMEKAQIWKDALGFVYSSNEEFEREFGSATLLRKVYGRSAAPA